MYRITKISLESPLNLFIAQITWSSFSFLIKTLSGDRSFATGSRSISIFEGLPLLLRRQSNARLIAHLLAYAPRFLAFSKAFDLLSLMNSSCIRSSATSSRSVRRVSIACKPGPELSRNSKSCSNRSSKKQPLRLSLHHNRPPNHSRRNSISTNYPTVYHIFDVPTR